jgi:hypothetical protein
MKTSTKTKTAIVIGELPSASNASNPLLVHSAAVVASVRGGLASGGINPWGQPLIFLGPNLPAGGTERIGRGEGAEESFIPSFFNLT